MPESFDAGKWVYVLVQNSGRKEQIVGQHDAEKDVAFHAHPPRRCLARRRIEHMGPGSDRLGVAFRGRAVQ